MGSRHGRSAEYHRCRERRWDRHDLAITSTISGNGDQGADPNKLVAITDLLSAGTLPAGESFVTIKTAGYGEVLRGVSFTPGTGVKGK